MKRHLDLIQTIGRELRGVRKSDKISLEQIAKKSGVSTVYVSEIEREKKVPSDDLIQKLSDAYRIDEKSLYEGFQKLPENSLNKIFTNSELFELIFKLTNTEEIAEEELNKFIHEMLILFNTRFNTK